MIKSFTITNYLGDSIKLDLMRPGNSGFVVKHAEGLGPVKANINTTDVAMTDGGRYNSAYLEQRDIVMNLEFYQTPGVSIEDIRQKSYRYFPIKRNVTFTVETDNRTLEAVGYVESNEPAIFAKNEGCSITIVCPDPYFYSKGTNETVFSGVMSMFEFPFENNSIVLNDDGTYSDNDDLIEFGRIENRTEETVFYDGDSEVGLTVVIHAVGPVSDLTIYNLTTRERMIIDTEKLATLTGSSIIDGDTIYIKTRRGQKSITLLRDGVNINILNCLGKGSKWFTLSRGDNIFVYNATVGKEDLQFRIVNNVVYDGV